MPVTALQTLPMEKEVVKKHVGAIHIKNDSSCLQRKLYDALLFNAYEELNDFSVHAHSIRVKELSRLVGFDSKNVGYLRESLVAMVTTPLEWNIIDENGKAEWGVSGALADADIVDGICTYSYSRQLRKKLSNPTVYSNIDLAINRRFNLGPGIALYQNIVRYRGVAQTPYFPLALLKDLIGVGGNMSYEDFKIFNRAVIKPAVKEINSVSDIVVSVEAKRQQRRVTELKFLIQEQGRTESRPLPSPPHAGAVSIPPIEVPAGDGEVDPLAERLQAYYMLTPRQCQMVLADYPRDRVQLAMIYVEQQYKGGKVKRIAPYFLKVVKEADLVQGQSAFDLEAAAANDERDAAAAEVLRQQNMRDRFAEVRRQAIDSFVAGMDEEQRQALVDSFGKDLATRNKLVYSKYVNSDKSLKNKMVAAEFTRYVEEHMVSQKLMLSSEAAYVQFAASQTP